MHSTHQPVPWHTSRKPYYVLCQRESEEFGGGLIDINREDFTEAGREALQQQADRMTPRGIVLSAWEQC